MSERDEEELENTEEAVVEQLSTVFCELLGIPTDLYVPSVNSRLQNIEFKERKQEKLGGEKGEKEETLLPETRNHSRS